MNIQPNTIPGVMSDSTDRIRKLKDKISMFEEKSGDKLLKLGYSGNANITGQSLRDFSHNIKDFSPTWDELGPVGRLQYLVRLKKQFPGYTQDDVKRQIKTDFAESDYSIRLRESVAEGFFNPHKKQDRFKAYNKQLIAGAGKELVALPYGLVQIANWAIGSSTLDAISEGLKPRGKHEKIGSTITGVGTGLLEIGAVSKGLQLAKVDRVSKIASKIAPRLYNADKKLFNAILFTSLAGIHAAEEKRFFTKREVAGSIALGALFPDGERILKSKGVLDLIKNTSVNFGMGASLGIADYMYQTERFIPQTDSEKLQLFQSAIMTGLFASMPVLEGRLAKTRAKLWERMKTDDETITRKKLRKTGFKVKKSDDYVVVGESNIMNATEVGKLKQLKTEKIPRYFPTLSESELLIKKDNYIKFLGEYTNTLKSSKEYTDQFKRLHNKGKITALEYVKKIAKSFTTEDVQKVAEDLGYKDFKTGGILPQDIAKEVAIRKGKALYDTAKQLGVKIDDLAIQPDRIVINPDGIVSYVSKDKSAVNVISEDNKVNVAKIQEATENNQLDRLLEYQSPEDIKLITKTFDFNLKVGKKYLLKNIPIALSNKKPEITKEETTSYPNITPEDIQVAKALDKEDVKDENIPEDMISKDMTFEKIDQLGGAREDVNVVSPEEAAKYTEKVESVELSEEKPSKVEVEGEQRRPFPEKKKEKQEVKTIRVKMI